MSDEIQQRFDGLIDKRKKKHLNILRYERSVSKKFFSGAPSQSSGRHIKVHIRNNNH